MTINRRKKSRRQPGSNTHGWGKNKHRGSGSRGGVGNAGRGKRAATNMPRYWKQKKHLGKHGFSRKGEHVDVNAISLRDLEDKLPAWIQEKKATANEVNLGALGYDKLLSTGKLTSKLKIIVPKATPRAAEKVTAAGGETVSK